MNTMGEDLLGFEGGHGNFGDVVQAEHGVLNERIIGATLEFGDSIERGVTRNVSESFFCFALFYCIVRRELGGPLPIRAT
jgi:hypothetical protein